MTSAKLDTNCSGMKLVAVDENNRLYRDSMQFNLPSDPDLQSPIRNIVHDIAFSMMQTVTYSTYSSVDLLDFRRPDKSVHLYKADSNHSITSICHTEHDDKILGIVTDMHAIVCDMRYSRRPLFMFPRNTVRSFSSTCEFAAGLPDESTAFIVNNLGNFECTEFYSIGTSFETYQDPSFIKFEPVLSSGEHFMYGVDLKEGPKLPQLKGFRFHRNGDDSGKLFHLLSDGRIVETKVNFQKRPAFNSPIHLKPNYERTKLNCDFLSYSDSLVEYLTAPAGTYEEYQDSENISIPNDMIHVINKLSPQSFTDKNSSVSDINISGAILDYEGLHADGLLLDCREAMSSQLNYSAPTDLVLDERTSTITSKILENWKLPEKKKPGAPVIGQPPVTSLGLGEANDNGPMPQDIQPLPEQSGSHPLLRRIAARKLQQKSSRF